VSSDSVSIQNWIRSALGKCLSLTMAMPYGSLFCFLSCILPEHTRSPGALPRSHTSNVFNLEMWAIFAEVVSICCFLPVARWRGGSWASMSLALSGSWTLGKHSPSNLNYLAIFAQKPSGKLQVALKHRSIRALIPSYPFPSEPQMRALECWNPAPAFRSNSQEIMVLPF